MNQLNLTGVLFVLVSLVVVITGQKRTAIDSTVVTKNSPAAAQQQETTTDEPAETFAPVDNMHHFMEYICEPSYKALKQIMKQEPENRQAWKAFKNHSLVLAETAALLPARGPQDDEANQAQWTKIALDVHLAGAELYQSAGKFADAKRHYGQMIDHCNRCHTVFAEGKHQLEK